MCFFPAGYPRLVVNSSETSEKRSWKMGHRAGWAGALPGLVPCKVLKLWSIPISCQSEMCKFEQFLGSRCVQLHVLKSLKSAMPCQSVGICIFLICFYPIPWKRGQICHNLESTNLCVSTCSKDCLNLRLSPYLCYGNVAGPLQPFAGHVVVSLLPRNIAQHIKRPHSAWSMPSCVHVFCKTNLW